MATVFVALGSNLGNRQAYLSQAIDKLGGLPQTTVIQVSKWHETDPVGGPPQETYLNGVAEIQTQLRPGKLLSSLQKIERSLGRSTPRVHWGPRVIDLDILAYDTLILNTSTLIIPHPRMHERRFVLEPLGEISPTWVHPQLKKSVKILLEELPHADH